MPIAGAPPAPQTVLVDGCTLSYRRAGSGPAVLFLHDAPGVRAWEPWMTALAERCDLIVPDHPGFGASSTPAWLDAVEDVAMFYLDVVEALGLRDVHLVGHGLGGWIACTIAVRHLTPFASLALIGSGGIRLPGVAKLDTFIISPEAVVRATYRDPALAEEMLAAQLAPEEADVDLKNRFAVARLAWQPRHDLRLAKWLHRVTIPTLVVWGDADAIVPLPYAAEFARLIPGARVLVIPDCGHAPQTERPEAFLHALDGFIASAS